MPSAPVPSAAELSTRRVSLPRHVVFRAFPAETVILNLESGKYHGLNPTAGRMLDLLVRTASIGEVAALLAAEFDRDVGETEADVCSLCQALLTRGLIELDDAGA
jgi:hypothetical protein